MEKPKSNIVLITLLLIIPLLIGVYLIRKNTKSKTVSEQSNNTEKLVEETKETTVTEDTNVNKESEVITIEVEAGSFYFKPTEIKVKKGDKVKIVLINKDGFHDWVIDEFNAKTAQVKAGEATEVEFVADKVGTFEYYCSVGNHRQMGMKGNLIVE